MKIVIKIVVLSLALTGCSANPSPTPSPSYTSICSRLPVTEAYDDLNQYGHPFIADIQALMYAAIDEGLIKDANDWSRNLSSFLKSEAVTCLPDSLSLSLQDILDKGYGNAP